MYFRPASLFPNMSTTPINTRRLPSIDKPLPHNADAERTILGAILNDGRIPNESLAQALRLITPADFYVRQNMLIFLAAVALQGEHETIDLVTVTEMLQRTGKMEEVQGGAGYVASLIDGLPRMQTVEPYAKIVRTKSGLRQTAYFAHELEQRALEGDGDYDGLITSLDAFRRDASRGPKQKLIAYGVRDFLTMDLPVLEYVIEPLFTKQGRGMIYSPRGGGKTFVTMQLAHAVAVGLPEFFVWPIPKRRPVVYVDGEMHAAMLQERQRDIARINGLGELPENNFLRLITRDVQKDARPKVNTQIGRAQIEAHLSPGDVLILDNISSLSPSSDEQETEDWAQIEDWFSDLCWHGVSVLFVHHAGKGGDQRGTSKREDLLDFVLKMRAPSDYEMQEGLRTQLHLTKLRGNPVKGIYGQPFEVALRKDPDGNLTWFTRQLKDLLREQARSMLADGMKPNDVVLETGLSRWAVARIARGLKYGPTEENL